jgi:hypothetical protein
VTKADDLSVGESHFQDEERRRSPRFSVAGWATIHCLPLEGLPLFAKVRNLSSGGMCLDVSHPLELGARTELLVCVNAACFRAAALVRGQREPSNTCLQFVQISQGAKNVLEDLIDHLTKLQTLTRKLRSEEIDAEMEQKLLDTGRFRIVAVGEDGRFPRETESSTSAAEPSLSPPQSQDAIEQKVVPIKPESIEIDLFG